MWDNSHFTLLVVGSLLALLDAHDGPKFIIHPEPIVAPLGDEVGFDCSLDIKADHLWWKHNGKLLPHVSNNTARSQMIFKMKDESQVGDYQCIAWYGASAIASIPARLSLAKLGPIPSKSFRSVEVSEGNSMGIKCRLPLSNPPGVIQYYKDNKTLEDTLILKSGTLLLTNITEKDSGVYSCSIINAYVHEKAVFIPSYDKIFVRREIEKTSPQFYNSPMTFYNAQLGTNLTLECIGFGEPVPRHHWRRKNGLLPKDRFDITAEGLHLINFEPSDAGVYICEIENGIPPKLEHHFHVIFQEAPFVEKGPMDRLVKEGERTQLDCLVRGKPFPKITWLLNGESLKNDSHMTINGSTILISEIEKRHAGMYQCMAENSLGTSFGSCTLRVEPRLVTAKDSLGVPSFTSGMRLKQNDNKKMMRQPDGNKHKKISKTKEMIPPTRPNVTRLTDRSVMVRWHATPNKGLPILFFKVQHRELTKGKGSKWMTNNEDIPPHVGSYEVGNLTPDRYYRFRIAAVYTNLDNKLSPNSARFCLQAGTAKQIPAAPKLIHTSAAGPESIRIVWEYQNNSKLPIEGFYVYYRSTSSAGEYLKATVDGEWTRSYVISYLEQDTAYDIKLQSFTVNAASDFSEILTQKTEKIPTVSPPPSESTTIDSENDRNETSKSSNQLYVTLGAVLGGLALILMLCLGIFFCNKHRHTSLESPDSDNADKTKRIQLEPINVNGHIGRANGHGPKKNGYVSSKVNITNNPLADADDDKNQNIMEISFITRTSTMTTTTTNQIGNMPHRMRRGPGTPDANHHGKTQKRRTRMTTTTNNKKIEINQKTMRRRMGSVSEDSCSSSDEFCGANEVVIQTCGLENDTWKRCDVSSIRTVENYG